ncbi:MAG: hypothetical protein NT015_13760 [Alphaproteobacteria bacterium]|nr:hypothetical protein [Alphaproteobacteria bacterium]
MKRRLIVMLATLAASCAPPPAAVQDRAGEIWSANTRAVLTGETSRAFGHQCSRVSPGPIDDVWTPTEADIRTMERELIRIVAHQQEEMGESPSPGRYYRQIAGLVIGGRRIIYVNGVDADSVDPETWRTAPIEICDGGPITFGVEYDPATRQFRNFAFNGAPSRRD